MPRADRAKGGRPPFDPVLMVKVLVLQTRNSPSDERTGFYLRDRLTWRRFLGLGLGDAVADADPIWTFREALTEAGAIDRLFSLFDRELRARGSSALSGRPVDAAIVAAPQQRNTRAEERASKEGRVPEEWRGKPAKRRPEDRDARWTVEATEAEPRQGEAPRVDPAIPAFGSRNHVGADRRRRLIRPPLAGHRRRRARRGPPGRPARPRRHRLGVGGGWGPSDGPTAATGRGRTRTCRAGACG